MTPFPINVGKGEAVGVWLATGACRVKEIFADACEVFAKVAVD